MTMVKVIRFEIADFKKGTISEFIVENSAENWEKIASSRVTRGIQFDQMLDFQFEKEEMIPAGFISPEIWCAMVQTPEFIAELAKENGEISEIVEVIEEIAAELSETLIEDMIEEVVKDFTPVANKGKHTITHNNVVYYFTNKKMAQKRFNEMKKEYPSELISLQIGK